MSRFASLLAAVLLAGCAYTPINHEENLPEIADSFPDRDQVVFGTSYITKTDGNGGPVVCELEQEIVGWIENEQSVEVGGCLGCTENFTLAFATESGAGCHSVSGLPTIAIAPIQMLQTVDPDYYEFLQDQDREGADGDAIAFASVNWSPSRGAEEEFSPILALYRKEDESGLDFHREYLAFGRFFWGIGGGEGVLWSMDLRLTE